MGVAVTTFSKVVKRQIYMPVNEPGKKYYLCLATLTVALVGVGDAYVTGGLPCDVTVAAVWNTTSAVEFLSFQAFGKNTAAGTLYVAASYDATAKTLVCFCTAAGATGLTQVADTTALASYTFDLMALIRDD